MARACQGVARDWNGDGKGMARQGDGQGDAKAVSVQGGPWCHPPAIPLPQAKSLASAWQRGDHISPRLAYNPNLLAPLEVVVRLVAH